MARELDNTELKYLPPQEIEAEQWVLGACLLDPAHTIGTCQVRPEDFYKTAHRKIFAEMVAMRERSEDVDIITMGAALKGAQEFEALGGPVSYMAYLLGMTPTSANIRSHEQIVINAAIRRQVVRIATEAREKAYLPGNADSIISECIASLNDVRQRNTAEIMAYRDVAKLGYAEIERRSENPGRLHGITTGLRDVDALTHGLKAGYLYYFAGQTGSGKTSFGMQIARAAAKAGHKIGVVSIEMSPEQLALRDIASESQVPLTRLLMGSLHEDDWNPITMSAGVLAGLPIWCAFSAFYAADVERSMQHLVQMYGCELLLVDYLQLMTIRDFSGTREQEVSTCSRMMKRNAKQLNVPVVALAQLNRSAAGRQDKRPLLSDLRESGALEQDADVVGFIHRDECKCPKDLMCACGKRYKSYYLQRKGRMDGTGDAELVWDGRTTSFRDM